MESTRPLHDYAIHGRALFDVTGATHTAEQASTLLASFFDDHAVCGLPAGSSSCWIRASKLSSTEEFQNLRRLLYRPSPSTTLSRAAMPGSQVFYGAANKRIALDEIDAQDGEVVGFITVRQISTGKTPCVVVGEYDSILNSGRSMVGANDNERTIMERQEDEPELANRFHYIDATIAKLFRRVPASDDDYLVSALLAENFFRIPASVVYPSVRTSTGLNIAISKACYDKDYEVVVAEILRVKASYGLGIYDLEHLASSCDFASSGEVNWHSPRSLPASWSLWGGLSVDPEYVGWRVPQTP